MILVLEIRITEIAVGFYRSHVMHKMEAASPDEVVSKTTIPTLSHRYWFSKKCHIRTALADRALALTLITVEVVIV